MTRDLLPSLVGAISEGEIAFLGTQSSLLSKNKSYAENAQILNTIRSRFADAILLAEQKQNKNSKVKTNATNFLMN